VVPWYQPEGTRTANATRRDVRDAPPWLERLIDLLPELRPVVTMGVRACQGWMFLLATDSKIPLLPTLVLPHCSPRNLAGRPDDKALIVAGMRRAAKTIEDASRHR
jgi:uracil-DNA glycosylase